MGRQFAGGVASAFLLLSGCGGGGGESSPPAPSLAVSPVSLSLTASAGGNPVAETFSLRATGGALNFSVESDTDLISASPTSGTAEATDMEISVELRCTEPESRTGTITIAGGAASPRTVSVSIECERPAIEVTIEDSPAAATGNPRKSAESHLSWRASSIWNGQGAVPYSIRSDRNDVIATPDSGTVEMNELTRMDLQAPCPDQDRYETMLTLEVDGAPADLAWKVRCQAGDARVDRLQLFQGVMTWHWDVRGGATQHIDGVADRHTVLAAAVTHESATVPEILARATDGDGEVLQESLEPVSTNTVKTDDLEWTTEHVYDVSEHYLPSHRITLLVDESGRLDETREDNNRQWVEFSGGRRLPPFKIVFWPIRTDAGSPPAIQVEDYMKSVLDLLPIGSHEVRVGETLSFLNQAADTEAVLDFLGREWNRGAPGDEYYYGIFLETYDDEFCGRAIRPGNVSVQLPLEDCSDETPAHEIGHNLSLMHAPWDCWGEYSIENIDPDYPYEEGGIGPRRGWLPSAEAFVGGGSEETHFDVMAYCSPRFISDYHYRKALEHRVGRPLGNVRPDLAQAKEPRGPSLALGGGVEWGMWTLDYVDHSLMPSRKPPVEGKHFLTLQAASGREIYRERLRLAAITHSAKRSWAARVPVPAEPVARVIILDRQETPVLVEALR
ncbi:MAG: hypothetical protein OXI11_07605 [Gammaproteobacteria bacterium]|nr:hypothetical protein [Gammaproteobacteria bacterium]